MNTRKAAQEIAKRILECHRRVSPTCGLAFTEQALIAEFKKLLNDNAKLRKDCVAYERIINTRDKKVVHLLHKIEKLEKEDNSCNGYMDGTQPAGFCCYYHAWVSADRKLVCAMEALKDIESGICEYAPQQRAKEALKKIKMY